MKKIAFALTSLLLLASCGHSGPKMDVTQYSWEGVGSDPLWAFRYIDGNVEWEISGEEGAATAAFAGTVSGSEHEVKIKAEASKFEAELKKESCSDGITDNQYDYKAHVKFDGKSYYGCGREYSAPQVQSGTQRSVTIETGSGTEATITNTQVMTDDGQVQGVITVSTGATDDAMMGTGEVIEVPADDDAMMGTGEVIVEEVPVQ